ncbi:MAG: hypothetical protein IIW48_05560 [Clostridia bacterium]|nr:hypothetical protein [Clostridia bacterium]
MVKLILGHKGAGKTKKLIELVNAAVENSNGNVVCIEQESALTYDINHRCRLVATDNYKVSGYDAYYGFLCGVFAGDHDITDVFADATLRIGGRDYDELAEFLLKVADLSKMEEKDVVFTVSADKEEIPAKVFEVCEVL